MNVQLQKFAKNRTCIRYVQVRKVEKKDTRIIGVHLQKILEK
jgi:hypothetical protein